MRFGLAMFVLVSPVIKAEARINFREYRGVSDQMILDRVEARDPDAIRELGYRDIKNSKAILEQIASQAEPPQQEIDRRANGNKRRAAKIREMLEPKYRNASLAAKMALGKRGDRNALKHFISCLSIASGFDREICIQALGYVGDKRAVKYLVPVLSEEGGPPPPSAHVLTEPYAVTAADALGSILPDVATQIQVDSEKNRVKAWLKWWKNHESEYLAGIE